MDDLFKVNERIINMRIKQDSDKVDVSDIEPNNLNQLGCATCETRDCLQAIINSDAACKMVVSNYKKSYNELIKKYKEKGFEYDSAKKRLIKN